MNIFLTGGTGFIGSYVALELVKNGHNVTILARNKNKVPALKEIDKIDIIQGEITDNHILEKLIKGKDACILIALNYTKETGSEVLLDDTLPTVFISDIAVKNNVKHFIYTSSTSVNDNLYMGGGNDPEDNIKIVTTSIIKVERFRLLLLLQHRQNSVLLLFTALPKLPAKIF